ncbi:respiratory nitrate reductase subunit gamma [Nocardiopsis salina]|uniref:respiratory nitrate reductase subunit gamma n=1 Tax=Nocardiopsis salina TaxID=245836 RepID=UPI00373AE58D
MTGPALFPFIRLVHAFSASAGYLVRPHVVHRSRGPHPAGAGHAERITRRGR